MVKNTEYDFTMQWFIILNKNQKFYNSRKIAEFLKNIAFSPKSALNYRFQILIFCLL